MSTRSFVDASNPNLLLSVNPFKSEYHTTSTATYKKRLSIETLNTSVLNAEYAVRGAIPSRAEEIEKDLSKYPFDKITYCNIGNPQQLKQKPLSFVRQVTALVEYPELIQPENEPVTKQLFPVDAIERAKQYYKYMNSSGAYTGSQGMMAIRQNIAAFIKQRDGFPADPNNIFLTNGASAGVSFLMQSLMQNSKSGMMIPIPQYPLYTATMALLDARVVPYYLDEDNGWSLSVDELNRSLKEAQKAGTDTRGLVIINPGNPTGQCLSKENIEIIIKFCYENNLVLLADEVYQDNIYYSDKPFHSFKKVKGEMGSKYADLELVSFHSTSKGFIGECGKRGGYMELDSIDPAVQAQIYKLASIGLCPNVVGQIVSDLMVKPPGPKDPSGPLYIKERQDICDTLQRKSAKLVAAFNRIEGMSCNNAEGAMYVFPRIRLPEKALAKAKSVGMKPDAYYCLRLLEATGVCTVPGSGFGQVEGTWHFRCTFLPLEGEMDAFIASMSDFHGKFMQEFK